MVLVPAKEKIKIYSYFLQEGVFACKKDNTSKNETLDIPNLHCFLVMRSLISRKFATEIFSWQWHYYFLTEEGIKYLREYLGLPSTVIPNTYKFNTEANEEEQKEGGEDEGEEGGEKRERKGERRGRGRGGRGGRGRGGRRGGRRGGEEAGETQEAEAAE
jgi:small subunit ribosomal protein S10e